MKTVAVIVINDPDMINQDDFISYQTKECYFKVYYIDKTRKEYNSEAEGAEAVAMIIDKVRQVEKDGASLAVVYAYANLGVNELRKLVSIPVIDLGTSSIHVASLVCQNHFTIIPPLINYNDLFNHLLDETGLRNKFIQTKQELGFSAAQLKNNPDLLSKLTEVASYQIEQNNVDTITLGCGFFIGTIAKQLEQELHKQYSRAIKVIDPVAVTLQIAAAL